MILGKLFQRCTIRNFKFAKFQQFYFSKASEKLPIVDSSSSSKANSSNNSIQPWVEVENQLARTRNELVLSDHEKIENYVLSVVRGYFRTTYKQGVHLESNLYDHGLDSLDAIELGMVLEDELGYIIEAEVLPKFTKPKHFVNYIKQMEAYKAQFHMLPQEIAKKDEENWDDYLPYGEKLKEKLCGFTKNDKKQQKH